jgi:GNAT superfamily N-acetyltransferase
MPRRAARPDLPAVAAVLSRAFTGDPIFTWALARTDPSEQQPRLERFFTAILDKVLLRLDLTFLADDATGAAVWTPPDRWRFRLLDEARVAPAMLRAFGLATPRLLRLSSTFERVHPQEPHYYLMFLGTDPAHQKHGIGSTLLNAMLARCDAERVPAYLEASKPANVPFYRRHGFDVAHEIDLDGVPVTTMRRVPRP